MAYTYYISTDNKANWVEIFPMLNNKVKADPEPGEIFKRWKTDEIKIDARRNPIVYSTLATKFNDNSTFGDFIYFKIKRGITDTFYFKCSVNDNKINTQNEIFYAITVPDDNYELVLSGYTLKNSTTLLSTFHYPTPVSSLFIDGSGGLPPVFEDTGGTVTWDNPGTDIEPASLQLGGSYTEGHKIIVILNNVANNLGAGGQLPTLQARTAGLAAASNTITISTNGKFILTVTAGTTATQLILSQDGGGSGDTGSFDYAIYHPVVKTGAALLEDVIDDFLGVGFLNTGLSYASTILWNDALPTGSATLTPNIHTYIAANPNNDYVIQSAAIWNYIMMGKVDAITGATTATHEISFKELMDILKIKMRIFWYIDSDGKFRLEHEKYFLDFSPTINLSSYGSYKPEVDRRVYRYEKSNLFRRISYIEGNEKNADWLSNVVDYDPVKTTGNSTDVSPPQLSTDIKNLADNPTTVSSSGYMLLQCVPQTTKTPLIDINASVMISGLYIVNIYLSWAWLIQYYFKEMANADESTANGGTISMDSVNPFKKQSNVSFYYDGVLYPMRPLTMLAGSGWIDKIELDLASGWYKIDVGFDPY